MPLRISAENDLLARIEQAMASVPEPTSSIHCIELVRPSIDDVRALRGQRATPEERLMVVLVEPPTPHVVRSLLVRADGVIADTDIEQALAAAVTSLDVGLRAISDALVRDLRSPELSSREKQVLAMLVLDMSNSEIASKLHVSESNVKFHLSAAFRKLGVRSRAAAAAMILDPDAGLGPGILRITPG